MNVDPTTVRPEAGSASTPPPVNCGSILDGEPLNREIDSCIDYQHTSKSATVHDGIGNARTGLDGE